jgi:putative oxidoreductase
MSVTSLEARKAPRRIGSWALQGFVAAAFLAAGGAKLAGVPFMIQLFDQVGIGQWFRIVTGAVEIIGAVALLYPGLASIGAVATHLFVLHSSPAAAVILGALNAVIVYLRRDELRAFAARIKN